MAYYALRDKTTGKLMGVETHRFDDGDYEYEICPMSVHWCPNVFVVETEDNAAEVASGERYRPGSSNDRYPHRPEIFDGKLEVVQIGVIGE